MPDITPERIAETHARLTPVLNVRAADFGLSGEPPSFKLELLQHAGSFKTRGAEVVAASGGNYGPAVRAVPPTARRPRRRLAVRRQLGRRAILILSATSKSRGNVMTRQIYTSNELGVSVAPLSQAVRAGEFVYLSGQIGTDPATGRLVGDDVTSQAEQVFRNLAAVLRAADLTFDDVVKASVFLTRMADFAAMNAVYARHFAAPYPARTTVAVAELPFGARIEIDLVARRS